MNLPNCHTIFSKQERVLVMILSCKKKKDMTKMYKYLLFLLTSPDLLTSHPIKMIAQSKREMSCFK